MTAGELDARLVAWARAQGGIAALVQMGSRVQPGAVVDAWSDWDFHLISADPAEFAHTGWAEQIAPCWAVHLERTPRGVVKLSVVFAGGWEADFVLLAAWQMRLVYWAMARPGLAGFYPAALRRGIAQTRLWLRPGYRVVAGGAVWERRLRALEVPWPEVELGAEEFAACVAGFWRHAVWVGKKIVRGELRAAERGLHRELRERTYVLLVEEARLAGRAARPEARRAEAWLDGRRLAQTAPGGGGPGAAELARALRAELELFREVSAGVAARRGFVLAEPAELEVWLRGELERATSGDARS